MSEREYKLRNQLNYQLGTWGPGIRNISVIEAMRIETLIMEGKIDEAESLLKNSGMTQEERNTIRSVFKDKYFDIRVFRFLVNYKTLFYMIFGGWFLNGLFFAFYGFYDVILPWFYTAFSIVVIGGIDHIIIGRRTRLILRILEDNYGIEINQSELIETCRDLIK